MTAKKVHNYCSSLNCPFENCKLHKNQINIDPASSVFTNYEEVCKKYLNWLAYYDYYKYVKLKEKAQTAKVNNSREATLL